MQREAPLIVERQVRTVIGNFTCTCLFDVQFRNAPIPVTQAGIECLRQIFEEESVFRTIAALLLVYLGKDNQGVELAKEVAGRVPVDFTTLGNLDKTFVTVNDYKASVSLFEQAFAKRPSEDMGSLWFYSVLRTQDFKAMFSVNFRVFGRLIYAQIALKLHSLYKSSKFVFWAILSLHLQKRSPTGVAEPRDPMKLAEKMILKAFSDSSGKHTLEELLLLISTLQYTENHAAALHALTNANAITFPNPDEKEIILIDLLQKNMRWEESRARCEELLRGRGIFDWSIWKLYIKAAETLAISDSEVETMIGVLEAGNTDKRSLLLARIDKEVVLKGDGATLAKHVLEYINEFKDKNCCVPDVQHICSVISPEVLEILLRHCCAQHIAPENYIWVRMRRIFRKFLSGDMVAGSLEEIDITERMFAQSPDATAESLAGINCHLALLYIDVSEVDSSNLFKAIEHAHKSLELSAEMFAPKLLLIPLYVKAGAIRSALEIFRSLDIKNLQLDTLAYLISDHLLELGDHEHAEIFFHEAFFVYDDNRTQSWGLIADAFGRGSYTSVPEFYEFARRLEYSVQAVACISGTIRTELLLKPVDSQLSYLEGLKPDELLFDDEFMDNLSDNRDRDCFDLVDVTGNLRRVLLDRLPSFGRKSVVTYTHVPLLFRALAFDDKSQIVALASHFGKNVTKLELGISAEEDKRMDCLKAMLAVVTTYFQDRKVEFLFSTVESMAREEVALPSGGFITGDSIRTMHWRLERLQWLCLLTAFAMRGVVPKARRQYRQIGAESFKTLEECISKNRSLIEEMKSTAALNTGLGQGIKDEILVTLGAFEDICKNSSAALVAACDMNAVLRSTESK